MRFLLVDHIDNALHSLKMNRARTILTTTGLMIGIASITAILSLAGGVTSVVNQQITSIGGNVAVIRPGERKAFVDSFTDLANASRYSTSTLTESDLDAVVKANQDLDIAPIMTLNATLHADNKRSISNAEILATTPALEKTTHIPMDQGQFIDSTTANNTAVVGMQLAVDLFGTSNPLGQTFTLRDESFTVIGVLKKYNNPFNYDGVNYDNLMIISLEAGKTLHEGIAQIQQFTIHAPDAGQLNKELPGIKKLLLDRHGEQDFSIIVGKDIAISTNDLFIVVASVISAIAAISLIVGGIGVMNIMLVGVAERTREVGIRKAVGASNGTIVAQFMVESLIMSLGGGILGFTLGIVLAFTVGTQLYFTPIVTWQNAAIALGTSIVIGVLFGLYPALRASRKDPIESLRQYR